MTKPTDWNAAFRDLGLRGSCWLHVYIDARGGLNVEHVPTETVSVNTSAATCAENEEK